MKKTVFMIGIVWIGLCALRCDRKPPEEHLIIRPESFPETVVLPAFGWEKAIRVRFDAERDSAKAVFLGEELASALTRHPALLVLRETHPPATSTQPGYELTGSVKKIGHRFEMTAVVTDRNQQIVSDQNYLEAEENLLTAVEKMRARTLAALDPDRPASAVPGRPVSPDALDRTARARLLLGKKTRTENRRSIALFQDALRLDSTLVPALTGLAEGYLQIVETGWEKNRVFIQLAQAAAQKAVQIAPDDPRGHLLIGRCLAAWGDFRQAEAAYRKALDLNPNQMAPWAGLGRIYARIVLYEPALACYERALELDPDQPDVAISRALMLIGIRRYRDAETLLQTVILNHPDRGEVLTYLALAQTYQGRLDEARRSLGETADSSPLARAVLAMIEAKSGNLDAAFGEVELEVKPFLHGNGSLAVAAAAVYALLGRNGLAVHWLEEAFESGYRDYVWLANDPNFDGVRKDDRFKRLLEKFKARWEDDIRRYFGMAD
ncbi:MAG TPA: tetratricopeptide repeat protein [bacterium]|nr:tetratricopeptide repeat protein [bacterium]